MQTSSEPEIPVAPWAAAGSSKRGRPPITRDDIIDAALAILDADGVVGLNMRTLAARLDTGPSTLYWHVTNKDQLFDLIFDRIIGEFPRPEPDPQRWTDQLREIAHGIRRPFMQYRDLSVIAAGRFPIGPNALRFLESLTAVAHAGGLSDRAAAHLTFVLPTYAQSAATEEHDNDEQDGPSPDDVRSYIESLPSHQFENLIRIAPYIAEGDLEDRFDFGLDLLIAGLGELSTARQSDHDLGSST